MPLRSRTAGSVLDDIVVPYHTPGDRALGTFFKQLFLDCCIAFGGLGGAAILDQLAGTEHINWQVVAVAVLTLILKTAGTTAMKYRSATLQEEELEEVE